MSKITLEQQQRHLIHYQYDYWLVVDGKRDCQVYFNMRGYCVEKGLPMPCGSRLDPGEISLTRMKREITALNREWKQFEKLQRAA